MGRSQCGADRLVMLDDGVAQPIRISADGQRIEDDVVTYTLSHSRACAIEPSVMDGSCRAAGSHCIAQLPTASPGQALRACNEGVGAGCSTLLRQLRENSAAVANDTGPAASSARASAANPHLGMIRGPARRKPVMRWLPPCSNWANVCNR